MTASVQNAGASNTVQPRIKSDVNAAGTRLRRRLSKIFHCDRAESGLRTRPPAGRGPMRGRRPSIQVAICQSPRIQRWRRLTSAL